MYMITYIHMTTENHFFFLSAKGELTVLAEVLEKMHWTPNFPGKIKFLLCVYN